MIEERVFCTFLCSNHLLTYFCQFLSYAVVSVTTLDVNISSTFTLDVITEHAS